MKSLATPTPIVVLRQRGDYLAVSAPGDAIRLGVVGVDEPAAREAFAASATRWLELCEAAKMREEDGD